VQTQDLVATATLRYLGTSAQKARLVVDLIRGLDVGQAVSALRYTDKAVATDIGRLLESAVANARQKRMDLDVDRLYVRTAWVDGGPMLKRIRPAPMGRAFRILKRMCHITLGLAERQTGSPAPASAARPGAEAAGGSAARQPAARRTAGRTQTRVKPAKRAAGGTAKKKGRQD
jgi:large subunit ribosomal protein L22